MPSEKIIELSNLRKICLSQNYSNVPVRETISILVQQLQEKKHIPSKKITELSNLHKICLSQNYSKFNNEFYSKNNSLVMGCQLSSIMAKVFLNHIENNNIIINKNKHPKNIIYFLRYVLSQIIVLYQGKVQQIHKQQTSFVNIYK